MRSTQSIGQGGCSLPFLYAVKQKAPMTMRMRLSWHRPVSGDDAQSCLLALELFHQAAALKGHRTERCTA